MSEKIFIEKNLNKKVFCPHCKKQLHGEFTIFADDKENMGKLFLIGNHLNVNVKWRK